MNDISGLLEAHTLRATKPRLLVLDTLATAKVPLNQKQIHDQVKGEMNLVTVYRILEAFLEAGLIHRHLSTGGFVLCSHTEKRGHHVLLSCQDCGTVEECIDRDICKHEDRIASQNGFTTTKHLSELIGVCSSCS